MIYCSEEKIQVDGPVDTILMELADIEHLIYQELIEYYSNKHSRYVLNEILRVSTQDRDPMTVMEEEANIKSYGVIS